MLLLTGTSSALLGAAARAQSPEPTLAQLSHRAWTARDGAPGGTGALAQTKDGFLWLGGATGLFRFDGVNFERYEPPAGSTMPSIGIAVLTALPDGALGVGYALGGVSVISRGRIANYGARDGLLTGPVNALALDSAGTLWVSTTKGLAYLTGSQWHTVGADRGYPGGFTNDLTVDGRGALWVDGADGVFVLTRGTARFTRRAPALATGEGEIGTGGVRAAPSGEVWSSSLALGVARLADSVGRPLSSTPYYDRDRGEARGWRGVVIDRHAHAWGRYTSGRLVRVTLAASGREAKGRVEWDTLAFSPNVGTSGRTVFAVLEDREGNIWVSTDGGLDQFRMPKFLASAWTYPDDVPLIAAADSGAIWVGGFFGRLHRVTAGAPAREVPPAWRLSAMQRDVSGEVWAGGRFGLWHERDGQFATVALPAALRNSILIAITNARDGTLYVSAQRRGVFRRVGSVWERYGASDATAAAMTSDSAGWTWLGYMDGRLVREGGQGTQSVVYGVNDGLSVGSVLSTTVRGANVWVGGDFGVAVLAGTDSSGAQGAVRARFAPLLVVGEQLRSVSGIVVTDDELWVRHANGVARVPSDEVRHALREPAYHVHVERFDARDRIDAPAYFLGPTAVLGTDGRLWVSWIGGFGWIDPSHIRRNEVPPPVMVRALAAGGRTYAESSSVTLPERTSALNIAYTALSLAVPERVQFRYRLVGLDTTWQDAGPRREAFYTNLRPGEYRFEVTAANDDGVWSVAPAAVDILIPPAFVQTNAFLALCAVAAGGAVWLLLLWRQQRNAAAMRARFDVTLAERTRVARELHDTLLTDVAGIRMQLDAVARVAGPAGIGATIAAIRDQAGHVLVNARQAVVAMRTPAEFTRPVDEQLAEAARRIFADTGVTARVSHTGIRRRYSQIVEIEAFRIGVEALTNCRNHADCRTVSVTCAYRPDALRLEVHDDGRGFDPALAGANGHYGLLGMRERAAAIGARFTLASAPGQGTTVVVVIPRDGAS
ncbi:MAG: hypothetical protein H7099_05290 [Gemmatimonadaceae bacterium]|nr:hypothetical protein [Gemmatimonadaceae bacterium]